MEDVGGDVVECGVASGRSLAMLASLVRSSDIPRYIWGFDNWSGLPAPSKEDLALEGSSAAKGRFAESNVEMVLATLRWHGFGESEIKSKITLVKGLFSDTLPKFEGSRIALLHIDADLYESYKDSLQYLWPKVSIGGIVAFDEYHASAQWPGAKQAVDEFFSQLAPESVRLCRDNLASLYYAVKMA